MKKNIVFVVLSAAAILSGCTKDNLEQETILPKDVKTVLSASLSPLSKTAIDGVKVSWTKGDAINACGAASQPLAEDTEKAEFAFTEALSAPYSAVYPASLYKDASTITLPAVWEASVCPTPLAAYSESSPSLEFSPATALLKLQVTGSGETLKQVSVRALGGETLSGDFTIDYKSSALTPAEGGSDCVTVASGAALGSTPLVVYVPVPAGKYDSGLQIDFEAGSGKILRKNLSAREFTAGSLRSLPVLDFGGAKGIMSAADFLAFATAVNAGESTEPWENAEGVVNLLADIDFTGVTDWTPVGNATAPWGSSYNPAVTDGHPFTGKFDGNAHHIKNLHLVCDETTAGKHFGIFGYLGPGALVQNFVIEDNCSLTVNSSAFISAGIIAGVVYDATVRDISSYAPLTYSGSATGALHMALIGGLYAKNIGCIVDSVHNRGAITASNTTNLNAGATAIHIAGIVGFANAPSGNAKRNVISDSNNYGDIDSQTGRTSGIVAAANSCTDIVGCENHGNQTNSMPSEGAGRLGNITCIAANGSTLTRCKNYGNLISTTGGRVGGLLCLPNTDGVTYSQCENYGEIISDSEYRGVFFAYNNKKSKWNTCHASGKVGAYKAGSYEYDVYPESTKIKYLGYDDGGKGTYTDITYDIATGDEPVIDKLNVDAGFRIFFIGNSFTKDAVEHLPGIIKAAGLDNIQLVHMYYGGRTIPEYNGGWDFSSDYSCYVCNPGETGWTTLKGYTLGQIAMANRYDVVTVQEHTGRLLAWGWTDEEKAAVEGIVTKIKEAQASVSGSPKLYYILSQAYFNMSKAQNVSKPFSTQAEMWTIIAKQAKTAVETCGFDGVISTGAMLQNLRSSSINNSMELTRDGYHMDYGIARYGASCTVFESIIGPFNGNVKLDSNTYRYTVSSTTDGSYSTPVTDANAPIALQAARYAIAKPYEVTDMGTTSDVEKIFISDAAQLLAFAQRVNSGDEAAISAEVTLTADIDCSSVTSWTPIGNCTMSSWAHSTLSTSGVLFTGTFDGAGHSIKNLHLSFTPTAKNKAWGFFGGIGNKAVVKDLTFDSSCSLNVSTAYAGTFGMLAGLVTGATITNVKNYAPITGGGTSKLANNKADGRVTLGALIGNVQPSSIPATLTRLYNAGAIGTPEAPLSNGGNSGNGANAFHLGGIAGFSSNTNNTTLVKFIDCTNDADIYSAAGRSSGILAAANRYTVLQNCVNNGDQTHSGTNVNYRLGNITCIAAAGCVLEDCINRGNLTSSIGSSVAGVICLVNDDSVKITRCSSIGADIISESIDPDQALTYNGVLYGQCPKNNATFSDCYISGRIGNSAKTVTLTAENYFQYAGQANSANSTMTTGNIKFYSE